MNPELHNALITLLKAVGQQAPHLTAEENITLSSQMICHLAANLANHCPFWHTLEYLEEQKKFDPREADEQEQN